MNAIYSAKFMFVNHPLKSRRHFMKGNQIKKSVSNLKKLLIYKGILAQNEPRAFFFKLKIEK